MRFSARARRVTVRVHLDGAVELVIPRGVSERRARAFLESRGEWVRTQVARRRAHARPEPAFPPARLDLCAIGESWGVYCAAGGGRPRIVPGAASHLALCGEADAGTWKRLLRRWLVDHARRAFAPLLEELARTHGFSFAQLSVRAQRSRWGSCSTRGTISLNVALLFQQPEVLRYLMCHELAHTRHMNHSAAFWRCVAACEPQWRALDRALVQGWHRVPRWLLQPRGEA